MADVDDAHEGEPDEPREGPRDWQPTDPAEPWWNPSPGDAYGPSDQEHRQPWEGEPQTRRFGYEAPGPLPPGPPSPGPLVPMSTGPSLPRRIAPPPPTTPRHLAELGYRLAISLGFIVVAIIVMSCLRGVSREFRSVADGLVPPLIPIATGLAILLIAALIAKSWPRYASGRAFRAGYWFAWLPLLFLVFVGFTRMVLVDSLWPGLVSCLTALGIAVIAGLANLIRKGRIRAPA